MTITAREIVAALRDEGWLDAAFVNTGGGVYNVVFEPRCQHDVVLGSVNLSDGGDWGVGDYDTPAESVSAMSYAPNGDPVGMTSPDDGTDGWPFTVVDAFGAVIAVDALSETLVGACAECVREYGMGE